MILAKRLLFLAYCEMDGGQISYSRQRLVSESYFVTSRVESGVFQIDDGMHFIGWNDSLIVI